MKYFFQSADSDAKSISISTGTPAEQLFPRVARGQIVKVLAAIYRQKIVKTDSQMSGFTLRSQPVIFWLIEF